MNFMELLCISLWRISIGHGSTEHRFTSDRCLKNMAQTVCGTREIQAVIQVCLLICLFKRKRKKETLNDLTGTKFFLPSVIQFQEVV